MSGFFGFPPFGTAFPPVAGNDQIISTNAGTGASGGRVFLAGAGAGEYTNQSDLIVIGDNAFAGGSAGAPLTSAFLTGTTVIGSGALSAETTALVGPDTVLGFNALHALTAGGANVVIGANAVNTLVQAPGFNFTRNVVIGASAGKGWTSTASQGQGDNVLIGYGIAQAAASFTLLGNVIIGSAAVPSPSGPVQNSVVIGAGAGALLSGATSNTLIGEAAGNVLVSGGSNVIIGTGTNASGAAANNTLVGQAASCGTGSSNTCIGFGANSITSGNRNILLGAQPGAFAAIADGTDQFVVANSNGAMFYGNLDTGNLVVGRSSAAQRDLATLGATGALKMINGGRGAGNPTGGGFFYVAAGALHWVGSGGTDTTLAPA